MGKNTFVAIAETGQIHDPLEGANTVAKLVAVQGTKRISATRQILYMHRLQPSQLDKVAEFEARLGAEIINTTRHIFYRQHLKPS